MVYSYKIVLLGRLMLFPFFWTVQGCAKCPANKGLPDSLPGSTRLESQRWSDWPTREFTQSSCWDDIELGCLHWSNWWVAENSHDFNIHIWILSITPWGFDVAELHQNLETEKQQALHQRVIQHMTQPHDDIALVRWVASEGCPQTSHQQMNQTSHPKSVSQNLEASKPWRKPQQ